MEAVISAVITGMSIIASPIVFNMYQEYKKNDDLCPLL